MKDFHFGTEGLICQKNCEGWMVVVWEGLNLGSIPNDHMPSQKDPKIPIERRCSTILPGCHPCSRATSATLTWTVAYRYDIFLCSLDVQIKSSQIAKYLVVQLNTRTVGTQSSWCHQPGTGIESMK